MCVCVYPNAFVCVSDILLEVANSKFWVEDCYTIAHHILVALLRQKVPHGVSTLVLQGGEREREREREINSTTDIDYTRMYIHYMWWTINCI